jgi:hypothetical protein
VTTVAPDHLLNITTMVGAIVASVGVIGGAAIAYVYGRKINVQLEADAHLAPEGGVVVAAHPTVHAAGVRGLTLGGVRWQTDALQIIEVWLVDGQLHDGLRWDADGVFGAGSRIAGGETVSTTVLFAPGQPPSPNMIGWRVTYVGTARRLVGGAWACLRIVHHRIQVNEQERSVRAIAQQERAFTLRLDRPEDRAPRTHRLSRKRIRTGTHRSLELSIEPLPLPISSVI